MYIDGAPVNGFGQNNVGLIPTQDSVQEFRVSSSAVSPEFGRFAGGVVQMSTKSGTNAWHGSAYEYIRNTILNANNFFSNFNNQPRNPFHQNQYGTLLSGPIKRDKIFFLFSWEQSRTSLGVPTTTNMPTANMNAGKFYGKTLKTTGIPAGCITNGLTDAGGTYALVSSNCFDPSAVVMAKYYPLPNATTSAGNYFVLQKTADNPYQYVSRVDYDLSSAQRISARYTYWHLDDATHCFVQPPFKCGKHTSGSTISSVISDTYTINPTTILDIRASDMREWFAHIPEALATGVDQSQFGPAYAAMAPNMTSQLLPTVAFSGPDNIYAMALANSYSNDTYNILALNANLTKIIGRNTFKFGGELRYSDREAFGTVQSVSGAASFTNATLGEEYAAFLLGDFLSDTIVTYRPTTTFSYSQGYFLTNTLQATRSLTLNLGIRWELPGGIAEKKDRATVLLPNTVDPVLGKLGAVTLTNSTLYPSRSMVGVSHGLVGPRVGFAQRIGTETVIRGGYGLNYLPPDLPYGVMAYNSPVNQATTTNSVGGFHALSDPFNVLSGGSFRQPTGRSNPNWTQGLINQIVTGPVPTNNYPYTQGWNLALGREWKGSWLTEVSYSGLKGTHMPGPGAYNSSIQQYQGLNELSSQYYSTLQSMENGGATKSQLIASGQPLRPFPQYQDYVNTADYSGSTIYHAMYVVGEKRFHSGGVLHANYGWSKSIGNADHLILQTETISNSQSRALGFIQDFNNMRGERSLLSYDVRHRLVISYVLNLPFGKGQRFLNYSGAANAVVSGWSANGITTFQAGFPLEMEYNGNLLTTNLGAGTLRPNFVPGCNKQTSGTRYQKILNNNWFNAACFTYAGDFAFGNESRVDSTMRAQGINNFDFAVSKATKIKDRADFLFRVEFFNLFNHPQFVPPGTIMAGGGYNQITAQRNQPRLIQGGFRLDF
jgi:hypothetical protein